MVSPAGSGTGSGGSGSLGAPASPTQREIEASAWTEVNKAALGIVQDSIDIAFSQIDQRYSKSHIGTQTGYRASEDQPLLDHNLENVRIQRSFNLPIDESWNAAYEELVGQLPAELLERFMEEQHKPLNKRQPFFVAADNLFKLGAQIFTTIAAHCYPAAEGTLEAARTGANALLPFIALQEAIRNNQQVVALAKEYLNEQGANLINFDEYNNDLTQIDKLNNTLAGVPLKALLNPAEDKKT